MPIYRSQVIRKREKFDKRQDVDAKNSKSLHDRLLLHLKSNFI